MMKTTMLGILFSVLITGCAVTPTTPQQENNAQAIQAQSAQIFEVKKGKANLFIYRDGFIGAPYPLAIDVDGVFLGKTRTQTYFVVEVDPGRHSIVSHAENDSITEVNVVEGKNYFVKQVMSIGLILPRTRLQLMGEQEGKTAVLNCRRLEVRQAQ